MNTSSSKISGVKKLARKQFEKEKEEFNGILHASVRTKCHHPTKLCRMIKMHWIKTLIFIFLRFIMAVASDQHNYAIDIKLKVCIN